MTRARDRLYVCGTLKHDGDATRPSGWHALVTAALGGGVRRERGRRRVASSSNGGRRRARRSRPRGKQEAMAFAPPAARPGSTRPPPPAAAADPPHHPVHGRRRRRPQAVPRRAAGSPAADAALAAERGRLIHRLLQSLPEVAPPDRRARRPHAISTPSPPTWPRAERAALLDEVLAVLDASRLRPGLRAGQPRRGRDRRTARRRDALRPHRPAGGRPTTGC